MKEEFTIKWLQSIDSTNNEALRQAQTLDNLSVLAAYCQTAGRGQRGNRWNSRPGENLTFSLFLRFGEAGLSPLPAGEQFRLSEVTALALTDFLAGCGVEARIKWPNDIYVRDKKIAGVLIESTLAGRFLAGSIIGVGLNLNQTAFPPELINPTSLARVTGRRWPLEPSLEDLLSCFLKYIRWMEEEKGPERLRAAYLDHLYRFGIRSTFAEGDSGPHFQGTIVGITDGGKLLVEMPDGQRKSFAFKEIAYII